MVSKRLSRFGHSVWILIVVVVSIPSTRRGALMLCNSWGDSPVCVPERCWYRYCHHSPLDLCVNVFDSDGQSSIERNLRIIKLFDWLVSDTRVRRTTITNANKTTIYSYLLTSFVWSRIYICFYGCCDRIHSKSGRYYFYTLGLLGSNNELWKKKTRTSSITGNCEEWKRSQQMAWSETVQLRATK